VGVGDDHHVLALGGRLSVGEGVHDVLLVLAAAWAGACVLLGGESVVQEAEPWAEGDVTISAGGEVGSGSRPSRGI
jgi:hypothetical protein